MPVILNKLQNNESIDECDNLWIKKKNGEIKKNALAPIVKDLDILPFYDWSNLSEPYYFERLFLGKHYRSSDYSMSRGCVNRCSYCFYKNLFETYGIKKNIIRRYSIERAIEELVYLTGKHKLTFMKFHDSDFLNMGTSALDKFSSLYKKYIDLPNTMSACIDHVTEQKAKYLTRMNCRAISVGLESGNEEIRKRLMKRNYSNKSFIIKVGILKKCGIRVSTGNLIGLPGETRQNMMETIILNKKAGVDHPDVNIFYPFPNLDLTKYAIENRYLENNQKIDNYIFGVESPLKHKMSHQRLKNIHKCAILYAKLPFFLSPLIRFAEKYNRGDGLIWRFLRSIYFFKLHFLDFTGIIRTIRRYFVLRELER